MTYSNGFDYDAILPVLKGRLGWASGAGTARNFESFHALCTEQNLDDVRPDLEEDFEAYKDTLEDQIIQRCLSSVFNQPEFIEQALLHTRITETTTQSITNSSLFCGLRFIVVPDFRISTWIKTVTLLFTEAKTFNLYLYQEGKAAPIKTKEVTTVANTPTIVELTDWVLSYATAQTSVFYVGYFQDDLGTAQAMREQVRYNKTMQFAATSVQADAESGTTFNQSEVSYNLDTVGINAEVHAFRDYTSLIKRSPSLFDEAIGLSMVYFVIEMILNTTRSTATERVLKGINRIELTHYLYGSVPAMGVAKTTGLNDIVNQKFRQIRGSFFPSPKVQTVSLCS
jgi:hypothetical protein